MGRVSDHQNRAPAFAVRPTTGTSTSAGNVSGRSQEDERPFVSEQVVQVGTTWFFTRNSSTGASPPFLFFSLFFFPSFVPSFLTFLLGNSYMIRPRESARHVGSLTSPAEFVSFFLGFHFCGELAPAAAIGASESFYPLGEPPALPSGRSFTRSQSFARLFEGLSRTLAHNHLL